MRTSEILAKIASMRAYITVRMESSPKDLEFFSGILDICDELTKQAGEIKREVGTSDAFVDPRDSGAHRIVL